MPTDYEKPSPIPRKLPRQGRSKVLVDALVEACEKILEAGDINQLTTNHIADVAGVNIGSLYQYFPNKESILASVFTRKMSAECAEFAQQSTRRILAQSAHSLRAGVREVILIKAELHQRFLALHGDFYQDYHDFFDFESTVDEFVSQDLRQPNWAAWVRSLLQQFRDELIIDDVERAAFMMATTIDALLTGALQKHPDWLADDTFLNDVNGAVLRAISRVE